MITSDIKQQWQILHSQWIAATKAADILERELIVSLRLCAESNATPPTASVIDAFERARGKALCCRVEVALFVDKLFIGALPR